ncbi:hypothetical protein C8J57DRAFT_1397979 [Mycena rebaudengoi]|nr:hypothetical protein C8J57DRAFT_1397979 [Mycena rebaudengoi]
MAAVLLSPVAQAWLSWLSGTATIGSFLIGDAPEAIEKLYKLLKDSKKIGPGGYLGQMFEDLDGARKTIVDHAHELEEAALLKFAQDYLKHLTEVRAAAQEWSLSPEKKIWQFRERQKRKAGHLTMSMKIAEFTAVVVRTSQNAQLFNVIEAAKKRQAAREAQDGPIESGPSTSTTLPQSPTPPFPTPTSTEQDVSDAPRFPFPIPTSDFMGDWNTDRSALNASDTNTSGHNYDHELENPFTDQS